MKTIRFECDDKYEAEKLASLVAVQKDNTLYVAGVAAMVGNEIVIKLKDKSSHSLMMKDKETASALKSLLQNIARGKATIHSSDFKESIAEITLRD